jgi:hypothetical protein
MFRGVLLSFNNNNFIKGENMIYKLIAKNIAYYYSYLKQIHSSIIETEEELFTISGILDAWIYVNQKTISIEDIVHAACRSRFNKIILIPFQVDLYDGLSALEAPVNPLLNFTLTISALILTVDNPRINPNIILNSLKNKRRIVEKTIEKYKTKKVPMQNILAAEKILPTINIEYIKTKLNDYYIK